MAYTINSQAGYDVVQNLKNNPGSSQTVSDGSSWTVDKNTGEIMVTKDGVTTKADLAWGKDTVGSGGSSGGSGYGQSTDKQYYVGTDKGYQGLEDLYSGKVTEFTDTADGSTWFIKDGQAYANLNGYIMPIAFRPSSGGSGGSYGGSGGGSSGGSGGKLTWEDILAGLGGQTGDTTGGTTGGTTSTPSTSTVVDSALAAKDAYNEQIEAYKKQLLEMQNSKTPSAADQSEYIRQMYDQQLAANKAQLESNYNEGMSSLAGEESNLGANYYEQRRQAQANSDKSQANFNEMANAYGLNTGTGGQAQLARNNQLQSSLTTLGNAEAQNRAEIERQRTLLGQQYQSAIQQAQAENNMELAQALYQEAVRVDNSIIDASKYDSERALDILNTMLNQVSTDRNLATEEARQAAEIAAAGGKYGLYGQLYGLSDDVISQLESIYQKELSDTEYGRYLDNLLKAQEAGVSTNSYGGYSGLSNYGSSHRYDSTSGGKVDIGSLLAGLNGLGSNMWSGGNSNVAQILQQLISQAQNGGISNLMGADKPVGSGTSGSSSTSSNKPQGSGASDGLHKEPR